MAQVRTIVLLFFFFQAEDGIRDDLVTGVQTCALPIFADEHGWFFIADEVEAGLGRTGKMWGIEHFGVAPDLVSIGKALGGGLMPLGAVLGDDRSMGKDDVVAGTTFGGHPAACVAATVTITIMQRDRIPEGSPRL